MSADKIASIILEHDCPTCGVPAGEPCKWPEALKTEANISHRSRWSKAGMFALDDLDRAEQAELPLRGSAGPAREPEPGPESNAKRQPSRTTIREATPTFGEMMDGYKDQHTQVHHRFMDAVRESEPGKVTEIIVQVQCAECGLVQPQRYETTGCLRCAGELRSLEEATRWAVDRDGESEGGPGGRPAWCLTCNCRQWHRVITTGPGECHLECSVCGFDGGDRDTPKKPSSADSVASAGSAAAVSSPELDAPKPKVDDRAERRRIRKAYELHARALLTEVSSMVRDKPRGWAARARSVAMSLAELDQYRQHAQCLLARRIEDLSAEDARRHLWQLQVDMQRRLDVIRGTKGDV